MSEEQRAKYYQAHKDDEDEWGEPEQTPASSSRRRLASMISVRFSPDEAKIIREAAEAVDESVSQFVRTAALQRCQHRHHVAFSLTGTNWVIGQPQVKSWYWTTVTDGGLDAAEESHWAPIMALVGSTTA